MLLDKLRLISGFDTSSIHFLYLPIIKGNPNAISIHTLVSVEVNISIYCPMPISGFISDWMMRLTER